MSDFLTILKVSIIPSVERMIIEEEKHLNYLSNIERYDVTSFINESTKTLEGLKFRLRQYNQYLRDNNNDKIK